LRNSAAALVIAADAAGGIAEPAGGIAVIGRVEALVGDTGDQDVAATMVLKADHRARGVLATHNVSRAVAGLVVGII
jgi:hypothetical protein